MMQVYLDNKIINPFSVCSILIEVETSSKISGSDDFLHMAFATGFLITDNDKTFLISNWHVFSGYEFDGNYTKTIKDSHGALPERFIIHGLKNSGKVPLHLNDNNGLPTWFYNKSVAMDIAILELSSDDIRLISELGWHAITELPSQEDLSLVSADDVFIVGYPYGKRASIEYNAMPIYKSGSIASEPSFSYFPNRKSFLVDSTTRPGMSGSPVVAISRNGYVSNNSIRIDGSTYYKFLGIYSGRIDGDKEFESSLGVIWDKSLIFDLITQWRNR